MPLRFSAVAAIAMASVAGSAPVTAASQSATAPSIECSARADILRGLAAAYDETPIAGGRADNGSTVELFNSRDGKTWTLVVSTPDGTSCLMAAGQSWANAAPVPAIRPGKATREQAAPAPGRSL